LQLTVFFTSAELAAIETAPDDIYIVIDVVRATTTLTVMLDRGASRILIANSIAQAREAAQKVPGRLLCGEQKIKTPSDFNYGNSPTQFSQVDLTDQELILTTSNGTRAFFTCPQQSTRLGGCFYNAHAVTTHALKLAEQKHSNISLVCAGEYGYFALDDAICAGYLALELQRQYTGLEVRESVHAATKLYQAYPPTKVIDYAESTRELIAAGLQADLDFSFKTHGSRNVPIVIDREQETGLLVIGNAV
jgi:2-phosphosulfolactate phosphatase